MVDITYIYYDDKYVPKPFGVINTGSICWFNSAIQTLLSCSQFNYMMIEKEEKLKNNKLAITYIEILKTLFNNEETNKPDQDTISIKLLKSMISELKKQKRKSDLASFGQKDASEGIIMFIDLIDPVCEYGIFQLFLHRYENTSICLNCKNISYTNKTEPPNIPNDITFRSVINTEKEFIENILTHWSPNDGITCEKCGVKSDNSVVLYILKMVREIIMIIIRNTNEGSINPKNMIKNEISLDKFEYPYPEFIYMPSISNSKLKYKLVSVIEQFGGRQWNNSLNNRASSTSGGHYTATCYRDGKYWDLNDTMVNSSSFKHSKNAYVLMYCLTEQIKEEPEDKKE